MNTKQHKIDWWVIAFRVIFTIAVGWCILFIFHNSLEEGTLSSARSQTVMQLLNRLLGKVNLGPLSEHVVRKLAHFAEYALEGFLLTACLRVYTSRFVRHMSWPLLGGLLTALSDESIQQFVRGRSSSVKDVWIDFAGVCTGLLVALIILLLVQGALNTWAARRENRRLRAERDAYRKKASDYERDAAYDIHEQTKPINREDLL